MMATPRRPGAVAFTRAGDRLVLEAMDDVVRMETQKLLSELARR